MIPKRNQAAPTAHKAAALPYLEILLTHIVIHRDLSLSLAANSPARLTSTRAEQIDRSQKDFLFEPGFTFAINSVLYPLFYQRQSAGDESKAALEPPPPWLVALILVMRDGVIQGLTWAGVKVAVGHAMASIEAMGLAPLRRRDASSGKQGARKTALRIGVSYISYWESGERRKELFVGVERATKRRS